MAFHSGTCLRVKMDMWYQVSTCKCFELEDLLNDTKQRAYHVSKYISDSIRIASLRCCKQTCQHEQ